MDGDPIYLAPQDYSVVWPVLGGFIIFALLLWAVVIWLLTRRPDEAGFAPLPPEAVAKLRQEALAKIAAVEEQVRTDQLPARRGHHELSQVVRGFVSRTSGLEADTMTAADLRLRGPAHLAAVIEDFYPRQFGVDEAGPPSISRSAAVARQVIEGWSR